MIKLLKLFRVPHFLAHRWNKWETTKKGDVTRNKDGQRIGSYETQRRECDKCGRVELKNHKVEIID